MLDGTAAVRTVAGSDVTAAFLAGARAALAAAQGHGIKIAVLKDGSPSCASSALYDGTFQGRRRHGLGVTAALLASHGVKVFTEEQVDDAAAWIRQLEGPATARDR